MPWIMEPESQNMPGDSGGKLILILAKEGYWILSESICVVCYDNDSILGIKTTHFNGASFSTRSRCFPHISTYHTFPQATT